jgi:Glu-tRNA(Gln) amidotransferase subunit E-like FAD-binding protein
LNRKWLLITLSGSIILNVFLLSSITQPRADSEVIRSISSGYVQLHENEYIHDLKKALDAETKEDRIESAFSALGKVQISFEATRYLDAILRERNSDASMTSLQHRLNEMRLNVQKLISIANGEIPDNLNKLLEQDVQDAKKILELLNYQWIDKGDIEKIEKGIQDINKYLTKER